MRESFLSVRSLHLHFQMTSMYADIKTLCQGSNIFLQQKPVYF